ncbi:hypothetical protein IscW_ISCW010921 [Ixodes scapularis]|uniref:Uncharacterized protein n=1 Tax=Ixodes scapularis TaxID=6945 RepID=B7Q9G5_IXOSC|nr:hypothetical protein IscW_ISCW010921 [Ixodes scapularis]|eukprot:XP_002405886.1 hypothetical protein IscW_ISCW010921 [Ixodes scapularis]
MKKSPKFSPPLRRNTPPISHKPSSSSIESRNEDGPAQGPGANQRPENPTNRGQTNPAFNPGEDMRGARGNAPPYPMEMFPVERQPPPPASRVSVAENRERLPYQESGARRRGVGGFTRFQWNRGYYRTVPGAMGIVEVIGAGSITTALSLRGYVFDIFFFLCNIGFTYAFVGVIFFINGLLSTGRDSSPQSDVPLLVNVLYYGLGFVMFLAGGIAALVKSQSDFVAIATGIGAVVVAIALFVHVICCVRDA